MITDKFNRPLKDLRISVTDRCNFRCPYCMPAEVFGERYQFLPKAQILSFEEITRIARVFVALGVNKLRITGGEPLLRTDLHLLIAQLSGLPSTNDPAVDITLTTNGFLLAQQARRLKDAGLQRITVSLDTLDEDIFQQMNGRGFGTEKVLQGIEAAISAGLAPIKINSVVQKGVNDHTLVDLARRFKGSGHIVRFIEYMDVGNRNGWRWDQVVPADEIVQRIEQARRLKDAGLQRITVSLDTLDEDIFQQMNGRGFGTEKVLQGIEAAISAGLAPIKINSVVQKGVNDHTLVDLARRFKGSGHIVRFIEYMDVGNRNGWRWDQVVPADEIVQRIDAEMPLEAVEPNYQGEVARRYRYRDGQGEIGVIASVTQPFCGDCSRARLSTDGSLYTCLFASTGLGLRDPLRDGASDQDLKDLIAQTWGQRVDRYSEERTELATLQNSAPKVEMYQIGG